jgi:hypothetical protein
MVSILHIDGYERGIASMWLDVGGGRKNGLMKGVGGEKLLVFILLITSFLRYYIFLEQRGIYIEQLFSGLGDCFKGIKKETPRGVSL